MFNPNYLIGFYADSKDVNPAVYYPNAEEIVREDANARLRKHKEYAKYGCSFPNVNVKVVEHKIGMFPVYFLAIRDKSNKKVNYAVVNGQTGAIAIDLPVAFWKYIVLSLLLSVLIFLLINSNLVLTPKVVCIVTIAFGILSLILSASQVDKMKKRITHADDIGVSFVTKNKNQVSTDSKVKLFPYIFKELLTIIIPIIMLVLNPVGDEYYYFAAIAGLTLVVLSFYDLVKEHNILVSNKLPQLEKRGGDENA